MRISRSLLLAGAAAVGLAGATTLARAADNDVHVMMVQLPNGAIEQIRYTGDVAPRIVLAPMASPYAVPSDAIASIGDPFAVMQRMAAIMDQEAAAMLRAVSGMAAQPFGSPLTQAGFGMMSPGGQSYGLISTGLGAGVCSRSVEITYTGHGQPHVVSQTSGDCGGTGGSPVPARLPSSVAPAHGVKTIQVKAEAPSGKPYRSMVHQIAAWQR